MKKKVRTAVSELVGEYRIVIKRDEDIKDPKECHNNLYLAHKNGRIIEAIVRVEEIGKAICYSDDYVDPFLGLDLTRQINRGEAELFTIHAGTWSGKCYQVDIPSRTATFICQNR